MLRLIGLALALIAGPVFPPALGAERVQQDDTPLPLSISVPDGSFTPGSVTLVTVTAPRELKALAGDMLGRPIHFWRTTTEGEWRALVGIALDVRPGTYQITVRGVGAAGDPVEAAIPLVVAAKTFETRRLRVAARMAQPPPEEAARIEQDSVAMASAFAILTPERLWDGRFEAPVPGASTSSFGRLTVTNGRPGSRHQGTDFRAAMGTPVRAPNAGRVVLARDLYFAGNTVILDHGLGVFSLLAHLSRIDVAAGQSVSRGDVVGQSGATGRVTGPHLHWAVRFGATSVDPLSLMRAVAALPDTDARASH